MKASIVDRLSGRFARCAAATLIAAGCGAGIDRMPGEHSNTIELTTDTRATALDGRGADEVLVGAEAFLARQRLTYADRVLVVGGTPDERMALAAALDAPGRRIAADPPAIDGGEDPAAPLALLVLRTVATPPACGDWSDEAVTDFSNLPPRNYGCSDQSNLARMVADPADLAGGRPAGAVDGERHAKIMNAYRGDRIVITEYKVTSQTRGGSGGSGGGSGGN